MNCARGQAQVLGGSQGTWGSAHRSTPWRAFGSGMDAHDDYGSSDSESAGAPASNAVPAASPPPAPPSDDKLTETDCDSDLLEAVPGRSVGGKASRESFTAGQGRRAADPRPRKTSRKQTKADWTMICDGVSMPVVEERLQSIAQVELGHAAQWSRGVWKPSIGMNRDGVRRQLYRCPFRGPANCNCTA